VFLLTFRVATSRDLSVRDVAPGALIFAINVVRVDKLYPRAFETIDVSFDDRPQA
jgi:hypothetical protein